MGYRREFRGGHIEYRVRRMGVLITIRLEHIGNLCVKGRKLYEYGKQK